MSERTAKIIVQWLPCGVAFASLTGVILWELVPESHTPIALTSIVAFVVLVISAAAIDSQRALEESEKFHAEQARKAIEERRRAEEEREARMAAYKAVALLAERGISVQLPEEPKTRDEGKEDHA